LPTDGKLDGHEPVGQDEIVFRRVLVGQYKPSKRHLSPKGFNPRPNDVTGISLCRANYLDDPKPEAAAALGRDDMEFYVVELSAQSLADAGMPLQPEPTAAFIGHACIPVLRAATAELAETKVLMDKASKLAIKIHGPFPGRTSPSAL